MYNRYHSFSLTIAIQLVIENNFLVKYLKESKFRTRKELSDYLNCHIRTMERWLLKYTEGGLSLLLSPMNQNRSP